MKIGYACKVIGVQDTESTSCLLRNLTENLLNKIIETNLNSLEKIIDYNIDSNIRLFRISSDIIPFASHGEFDFDWQKIFNEKLSFIGKKISESGMRVTMHPGQYTVLNSPNSDVVKRAIADLKYHCMFLDSIDAGYDSKVVLHVGGVYNSKESGIARFISVYKDLDLNIKKRLVLENDDKSYTIEDVLNISSEINIPVIFDNLHHKINPSYEDIDISNIIEMCGNTWRKYDGAQKIHYSQQRVGGKKGSHSSTIHVEEFLEFFYCIQNQNIDIMLEVKDKNISAVKCINLTNTGVSTSYLEKEWARYKYLVLSKSQHIYEEIRALLKDKSGGVIQSKKFYMLVEKALEIPENTGSEINALTHIWGYFKTIGKENEKKKFHDLLENYKMQRIEAIVIKRYLKSLSKKYNQKYLMDSYYFEPLVESDS